MRYTVLHVLMGTGAFLGRVNTLPVESQLPMGIRSLKHALTDGTRWVPLNTYVYIIRLLLIVSWLLICEIVV